MSILGDELAVILAALEANGIRAAIGGQLAAPCVLVEPGDPWTEPNTLTRSGGRLARWRLTAIAGAVDTLAGVHELAELVDSVDAALRVDGVSRATWGRPTISDLADGVRRPAVVATIQYASS